MTLKLLRYSSSKESTLGLLFVDKVFLCYTLEDEYQEKKVMHETRIPAGEYKIKKRMQGSHYEKYIKKFPWHKYMLEIESVPGFTDILIHIGNTDDDTSGCILVGDSTNNNSVDYGKISDSTNAYERMYKTVFYAMESGDAVRIIIKDIEV